ncbi:MAG TPA: SMP-30/gluconolactonase/LRE family protein [Dongiaceae bacterium]|nr:SMP-30/gluconolactonase/LRE family protein [Dongiaceae bacterium]
MSRSPSVLLSGLSFPEAPRWHEGVLWFSDFYKHAVQSVDLSGRVEQRAEVPGRPSGIGFTPDGGFLVVSMLDRKVLRFDPAGGSSVHADLGAFAGGPCNDMVVLSSGEAYVGNFGYDKNNGAPLRATCLVHLSAAGEPREVARDLVFPNGMAVSADQRTLLVAETFAGRVTAFDRGRDGSLDNRRVVAAQDGFNPDGLCLDAEGAVWVADATGHRVVRIMPDGSFAEQIGTGERHAFACALGGDDRRTLFICTNTGAGHQMASKRDGRIEIVGVDTPGLP